MERARGSGSGSASGETFTGSGESPLQQHLYGLVQHGLKGEEAEEDAVTVTPIISPTQDRNDVEYQGEIAQQQEGHGSDGQEQVKGDHIGEQSHKESTLHKVDVNPYALLAYPTAMNIEEDESSDVEDLVDTVDPSTFFVSSPSSSPRDYRRRMSPDSFEVENEHVTIFQRASNYLKIPSFKILSQIGRAKGVKDIDDAAWSDDDWATHTSKQHVSSKMTKYNVVATKSSKTTDSPVADILRRYLSSSPVVRRSTANLLSSRDIHQLGNLGRSKAIMDYMALSFMYLFLQQCVEAVGGAFLSQRWLKPNNFDDLLMIFRQIYSTFVISEIQITETWAPFALVAFILSIRTRELFLDPRSAKLTTPLMESMKLNIEKTQLFLRVMSGIPIKHDLSAIFANTAKAQSIATVEVARLRTFIFLVVITLLITAVNIIEPICTSIMVGCVKIIGLKELHQWPI
jgi:hypothetical protein